MMHLYVASQLVKVIDFFMYLLSKGRFESRARFEKLVYIGIYHFSKWVLVLTTFYASFEKGYIPVGKTGRILGPA